MATADTVDTTAADTTTRDKLFDILVLNGPNLDQLGRREPGLYGRGTLADVEKRLRYLGEQDGITIDFFQSNAEHLLIERIRAEDYRFMIINLGAFTHTSIALRDALLVETPPGKFIEVHVSNVHTREPFRHTSYFSDIAFGTIGGFGVFGYELAYLCFGRVIMSSRYKSPTGSSHPAGREHEFYDAMLYGVP